MSERARPGDVRRARRRAQRGDDVADLGDHQAARGPLAQRVRALAACRCAAAT